VSCPADTSFPTLPPRGGWTSLSMGYDLVEASVVAKSLGRGFNTHGRRLT